MTLRFGWEPIRKVIEEPNFPELVRSHYDEAAVFRDVLALDLDYDRMVVLGAQDLYRVWVARHGPTLAGYVTFSMVPSLHHRNAAMAYEDAFVLAPQYRRWLSGYEMLREAFDALRVLGVRLVICHVPDRLGSLFDRLGAERIGAVRAKVL